MAKNLQRMKCVTRRGTFSDSKIKKASVQAWASLPHLISWDLAELWISLTDGICRIIMQIRLLYWETKASSVKLGEKQVDELMKNVKNS